MPVAATIRAIVQWVKHIQYPRNTLIAWTLRRGVRKMSS
jgi:hypothetical protein